MPAAQPVHDSLAVTLAVDPAKRNLDRCWLATVGRQRATSARVLTSSLPHRAEPSICTRVGSANRANDRTAALICSAVN